MAQGTRIVRAVKKKKNVGVGVGRREGGREGLRKAAGGAIDLHASHSGL